MKLEIYDESKEDFNYYGYSIGNVSNIRTWTIEEIIQTYSSFINVITILKR